MPGFQNFLGFLYHFVLAKLAPTSIRVDNCLEEGFHIKLLKVVYTRHICMESMICLYFVTVTKGRNGNISQAGQNNFVL